MSRPAFRRRTSRRHFLATSFTGISATAVAAGFGLVAEVGRSEEGRTADAATEIGKTPCLDYGRSFICHTSPKNSVRFWVESRTTIFDDENGTSTEFYQCGSCKSENTFAEQDLFHADNYDFLPIFGGAEAEDVLVFRRTAYLSDRYKTVAKSDDYWGKPILKLREGRNVRILGTWEEIAEATAEAVPLVSRTEISNPETKLRAVIECPIKTMNIHPGDRKYQVDTGPIAFPDLARRAEPLIDLLSLAFIAFNAPHFADFIVEQPTAVLEGEKEVCEIYHYSDPFSLPAKNVLLGLEG